MWTALKDCEDGGWKNSDEFREVELIMPVNLRTKMDDKINHLFGIIRSYLEKHFDPWCNQHPPFALYSETKTAQVIAAFVNGNPPI